MLFWLRKGFIGTFYFWIVWGETVYNHQVIGAMGCTGSCTGTHLHFEMWDGVPYNGGRYFDPRSFY